ncbi:MAG: putative lipoprotein [Elusimicrobia bacterium]|nr:MAG: putative lipoprotein [Elusimicrobiota bacterium]KAF0153355.1 MAG: putative lipoprotein [Elusimicrobiota bacterium]
MKLTRLALVLLLSPACPAFSADSPWFTDAAGGLALSSVPCQTPYWADLDGDGWPDAALHRTHGGPGTAVFMNRPSPGGRVFEDLTGPSAINAHPLVSTGSAPGSFLAFADVDNDGDLDLFRGRYCEFEKARTDPKTGEALRNAAGEVLYERSDDGLRSEILLNDGSGRFFFPEGDRTAFAPETAVSAAFLDYDNDGVPDLFIGNWYKEYGASFVSYPSRLYRGLGGGRFADMTMPAGLLTYPSEGRPDSSRPVYGVSHCDWDNDGLQDILVAVYGRQANRLWRNNGDGSFTDMAPASGFDGDETRHGLYPGWVKRETEKEWRSHGNTFAAPCADADNDGDMDVFLGEITHGWAGEASDRSSLLENLGPEKGFAFRRRPDAMPRVHASTTNWNQGDMRAAWLDFDNDGRLDLLLSSGDYPDGQYLRLFRGTGALRFEDVTEKAGFGWESSAGISVADYDGDGDLDILAGKSWMRMPADRRHGPFPRAALFRNNIGSRNNWLHIRLEGAGPGGAPRSAIGSRVIVRTRGLSQTREVSSSRGHGSQSDDLRLHFGLGKAGLADIEVRWGGARGRVSRFYGVPANRFVRIAEGADGPELSPSPAPGF